MKKFILLAIIALGLPSAFAYAHVTVTPKEAPVGSYQTFVTSVPSERDSATIKVRLLMPEGVTSVRPNVKPGWNVETVKEKKGTEDVITEILWTGGSVPAGFRDEFVFSVKTPASGTLAWKASQIYANGVEVMWNMDPAEHIMMDHGTMVMGPYSETKLVATSTMAKKEEGGVSPAVIAYIALVLSLISFFKVIKDKK